MPVQSVRLVSNRFPTAAQSPFPLKGEGLGMGSLPPTIPESSTIGGDDFETSCFEYNLPILIGVHLEVFK
jgi:hypothetical protein